jgi:AraC family transcriptional regulator
MADVFEKFVAVVAAGLRGSDDPLDGAGLAERVHLSGSTSTG